MFTASTNKCKGFQSVKFLDVIRIIGPIILRIVSHANAIGAVAFALLPFVCPSPSLLKHEIC
jgi:hypothetical protein